MKIKSDEVSLEAEAGGKVYAEPAIHLKDQGSPPSPAAGEGVLFIDSGDNSLKYRAESNGAVTNLLGVGGAGVVSFGRMGTDAVGLFNATPGNYTTYNGVTGWTNNTVAGAPYVTFVVDAVNGDYLLIGASGAGKYEIQFTGSVDEQGPGGPEVAGGWFFAFSVNNVITGPASGGFGVSSLTEPFTVSHQVVLDLTATDQVRLELSSWGAVNTLNIGGELIMSRMEAGENLAQTLGIGNTTGGTDIEVSTGDVILMGESSAPTTVANQGGLFVDVADNKLKYREESNGTITDLTAGGGGFTGVWGRAGINAGTYLTLLTGGAGPPIGVTGFPNNSVLGAPYVTFVAGTPPFIPDHFLIGASGAGTYLVQAMGYIQDPTPAAAQNWRLGFAVNGAPSPQGFGPTIGPTPAGTQAFSANHQEIISLVSTNTVGLYLYQIAGAPQNINVFMTLTIHKIA
jgi:hypothetical protein